MAQSLRIDTLAFAQRLKEAGADDRLAEAIAGGIGSADISDLATKADLAELKSELLKWMFGAMAAQTALTVTLVVTLVKTIG